MPSSAETIATQLRTLVAGRVASRVWQKHPSLWPRESAGAEPAAEIMGWLELPDALPAVAPTLTEIAVKLRSEGIEDAVVLGMGGSSMTPEMLRVIFPPQAGAVRLHVLDTVNPGTIGPVTGALDLQRTLFIVASKSGTTVEPLSLEKHFRAALLSRGVPDPARHFIAISDERTPLTRRAESGEFRAHFSPPADVGGRFSALTAFGMFPAALLKLDLALIQQAAHGMAERCRDDSENNPGLQLGAVLGASAVAGRDKVTLLTSPGLERFGLWSEQLLAESTGKNGKGLIPVANEPLCDPSHYGNDRNFIYLRLERADNGETDRFAAAMERNGHPVTTLQMTSLYDIGAEFFRWEFATAVAGHVIGIFPFDQPDVNAAKDRAREILGSGTLAASGPSLTPAEALTELLKAPETGDYVAIGAFVPESAQLSAAFAGLRAAITRSTGMATTFGYGPRYQHSIGQLYKGGPDSIRFLGLISHGSGDLQVPGEQYTLRALTPAQAYGDFEVMRDTGRRIQTGVLGKNPVAEIKALAADLNEA